MGKYSPLKPCPFCGSKDVRRDAHAEGFTGSPTLRYIGSVGCKCGAAVRVAFISDSYRSDGYDRAKKLATEGWNKRESDHAAV